MSSRDHVEILRLDPDLAAGIDEVELGEARRASRAPVVRLPRGPWRPPASPPAAGAGFGLLLLEGFVVRRVAPGDRPGAELLGPGDLLRPWQSIGGFASHPFEPTWTVAAPVELALLDRELVARMAAWPEFAVALVDRAMLRSRHLALTMATLQEARVDRRLHSLLWQLGDRWGRSGPEGVAFEAPLTHELLAELVAARRPSVSTALASLAAEAKVERSGRRWLLRGSPPVRRYSE